GDVVAGDPLPGLVHLRGDRAEGLDHLGVGDAPAAEVPEVARDFRVVLLEIVELDAHLAAQGVDGLVPGVDQLAAQLADEVLGEVAAQRPHAAAAPLLPLVEPYADAGLHQPVGAGQAGDAGADHHHVVGFAAGRRRGGGLLRPET